MFYTVYKITNLLNGKIYVGIHKTNNLEDGYMGSGINIKKAIRKYGVSNFKKEYLAIFDKPEEMYEMESFIVSEEFTSNNETYNISLGGNGGWDSVNSKISLEEKIERGKWLGNTYGSKAGSWTNYEKRIHVWNTVPLERRKDIGRKMGLKYGGFNKSDQEQIKERLEKIKHIDLTKFGWVKKVAEILEISHTQVRRFIRKYYKGEYYERKSSRQGGT